VGWQRLYIQHQQTRKEVNKEMKKQSSPICVKDDGCSKGHRPVIYTVPSGEYNLIDCTQKGHPRHGVLNKDNREGKAICSLGGIHPLSIV
jgi:hypothetical protein